MLYNHFTVYINRRIFSFYSILSLYPFSQIVTDPRFPSHSSTEIDKFFRGCVYQNTLLFL